MKVGGGGGGAEDPPAPPPLRALIQQVYIQQVKLIENKNAGDKLVWINSNT